VYGFLLSVFTVGPVLQIHDLLNQPQGRRLHWAGGALSLARRRLSQNLRKMKKKRNFCNSGIGPVFCSLASRKSRRCHQRSIGENRPRTLGGEQLAQRARAPPRLLLGR
jgi:hypothetical protein